MESSIRINKYLSQAGILSRRKADEAIDMGLVAIDGKTAVSGDKVSPGSVVTYKGSVVELVHRKVILAYYKPLGLECTSRDSSKDSIFRYLDYPDMLYYVGRLDKNSQGLLLLTNDGDLANRVQRARYIHEKEYVVRVDRPVTADFLKGMSQGVPLEERTTRRCSVKQTGRQSFRIILTEGLNRQIRRMCDYFNYKVVYLKRLRVMNIELGDMKAGEWREISPQEERRLRELLRDSVD